MKSKMKPLSIEECLYIENNIQTFLLFEYFHSKIYSTNSFIPTTKIINAHRKFFSTINQTHANLLEDKIFWWKYFLFQFIYWSKLELLNDRKVNYVFIIGQKAWSRWNNRNEIYDFTIVSNKIKGQYCISQIDFNNYLMLRERVKNPNKTKILKKSLSESLLRKRFHNTERGYNLCFTSTSLFDPTDKSCILCREKETCKVLLKNNNHRLFNSRSV